MHTMKYSCMLAGLLAAAGLAMTAGAQNVSAALDGAISIKSQEAVVDVPVQKLEYQVKWMPRPIAIDGGRADWAASGAKPVRLAGEQHASWFKGRYGGEKDFAANVWLGRDFDNFYLGVEMEDDALPAPNRIEVAFTHADTPLIVGWQDVGMRYKPDDLHAVFIVNKDGTVGMHWAKLQNRMDRKFVQDSYGSEAERRAILEQHGPTSAASYKIFTQASAQVGGDGKSTTFVEIAIPWKSLLPHDPVKGHPIKMNIGVYDRDGADVNQINGALAWLPGLVGTYSGAHFPTLTFEPPAGRSGVDAFAQVPAFHYLKREIKADVSLLNHGAETKGKLQLLAAPGKDAPLAEVEVKVPSGLSATSVGVPSEQVGRKQLALMARLVLDGGKTVEFPVFAPRSSNEITIQTSAEIEAKVVQLERNVASLSNLYARVEAAGLDRVYPRAYLTLLQMFVGRSRGDFNSGDSDRVLRNTAHLEKVYAEATAYLNGVLKDSSKQLLLPKAFNPENLKIKDGYWHDGQRPVFLWGPCTFWFMLGDTPKVAALGFNSVCPEVKTGEKEREKALAHMEFWRTNGVHVNAAISVPDLGLTGADVRASKLLQEHPELKNNDPNNFLSFVVQHPIVREKIDEAFGKHIPFWKQFKGVNSYWLWNEPWYVNYSELTRTDFIAAMKRKYKRIEALNVRWKSDYKTFEEILLVKWPDPKHYAPWYDFQQFRDDLLVDFFGYLHKTSKTYNRRMPTHTKFMAASLHSFNMERLQGIYDIAGHDGSAGDRDIIFLDFCRSVYPGKPLSNTEVHIGYGGKTSVDNQVWRLAFHGLADGNWWCWTANHNFSDSVGNAESMDALAFSGLDLQRLMVPHMHALVTKEKPIATLFPDVVERRSDVKMVRMRFEIGVAQYMLGLQPFYATEKRIAEGELKRHKVLFAGESAYVKEATYRKVLEFVKKGGTLIVTKGGFATNEYGDPRDASELVQPGGGEPYGDGARVYALEKGTVVCIDEIANLDDPVLDGGLCMRGSPTMENDARRRVYHRVLAKVIADHAIDADVRLVAARDDPDAMAGIDWRAVEVDGAYTLCAIPYAKEAPYAVRLQTSRPVAAIVDLITGNEVPVKAFQIHPGPNLYRIELQKPARGG